MFYPLSTDYIKYLNDPVCKGMNYDQWKEKMRKQRKKELKHEYEKRRIH